MAGDKTYITDGNGKLHRATRTHKVTPESIVWSSNPNDYAVQVRIDGKWHRAFLTMDAGTATYFDNINIDKALVTGGDGKTHTALICSPEASVTMSSIKTDQHSLVAGTTTGETAVNVYSETWSNVQWQDNINVYKVLVTGSDGKVHTALLTTSVTGGVEVIIKGTSPLVLPDAIANSLSYVKAYGGTEQNGTPTPDTPVDIVSNNGALKARRQSGLPLGYTLLEYITFSGTQYIDTGLAINNNTRVLFDVKRSTSSAQSNYPWLGGVRDYVNNTNINKKTLELSKSDYTKLYLQYATSGEITLAVPNTTQRHTYDFDKNKLYIDENLIYTATQETFTGNVTFLIGTVYSQGSVSTASMFYGDVYGFKLWQDGTNLSMNLIPAKRNSDNVIGMYDLVSGQFFTNQGTGDFVAGSTVSDPVEIYTDGTVETIEDTIGNTATAEMLLKVGNYQDEQEILSGAITRKVGVLVLDGTERWALNNNRFRAQNLVPVSGSNVMVCSHFAFTGAITTDNTIYRAPESAWLQVRYDTANNDVTTFTNFLKAQYAAGTPVIIVYPLATPTTESVAGQALQVTDGDNVLEITQASLNGLELEAQYNAAVSLTIQEVQDANLDNNVTVTIQ